MRWYNYIGLLIVILASLWVLLNSLGYTFLDWPLTGKIILFAALLVVGTILTFIDLSFEENFEWKEE